MELQKSNILTHFYLRLLHESCSLFCCLMRESDTSKSAFPLARLGSGVQPGRGPQLGRHAKDCLLRQVSWKSEWPWEFFSSLLFPFSLKICPNLLQARTRFSRYYLPLSFLRTRTSQILTLLTQGPLQHRNPDSDIILLKFLLPKSLVTSCSQIHAFFLALVDAFNTVDQSHLSETLFSVSLIHTVPFCLYLFSIKHVCYKTH